MGRYRNNKDGTLDLIAGMPDTSALANKTDISSIILTGTTNTSGSTITAGTWFYLNGEIVKAKVDIASNATFTLNTNYEKKTIGAELAELNSNSMIRTITATTSGEGIIQVSDITGYKVISGLSNGYMILPFITSSGQYLKVLDWSTLDPIQNESLTAIAIYIRI